MKKISVVAILCTGVWLGTGGRAIAAQDSIATDRPDFVESANTVGRGVFQIETSVAFERSKSGAEAARLWTTPTLLRYGLTNDFELRLETDGFATSRSDDETRHSGFSDTALGLKWRQQEGDEATGSPAVGWLLHLEGNTGSKPFRGAGNVPSLRATAEWELPKDVSVGVMPGVRYDKDDLGRRFWAGVLAVTYSRPAAPATRCFVELAARRIAPRTYGGSLVTADTGLSYLVDRDVQLDAAFAFGIGRHSGDLAATAGLSIRFR